VGQRVNWSQEEFASLKIRERVISGDTNDDTDSVNKAVEADAEIINLPTAKES
jgi:hypothetical protein